MMSEQNELGVIFNERVEEVLDALELGLASKAVDLGEDLVRVGLVGGEALVVVLDLLLDERRSCLSVRSPLRSALICACKWASTSTTIFWRILGGSWVRISFFCLRIMTWFFSSKCSSRAFELPLNSIPYGPWLGLQSVYAKSQNE